jgi:hypothetical protein
MKVVLWTIVVFISADTNPHHEISHRQAIAYKYPQFVTFRKKIVKLADRPGFTRDKMARHYKNPILHHTTKKV